MFGMAHDNDPLVPLEMQARRDVQLRLTLTVSMLRGLLAWLDRNNYSYSVCFEGDTKND